MKLRLSGLCILLCVFLLFGCAEESTGTFSENPGVRVTFLNVGKGDAIVIETQYRTMLIDTGYGNTFSVIDRYLKSRNVQRLDYLVLTHFDKDHVGGADQIIRRYEIGEILQPDYEADTVQYRQYCAAAEEMSLKPVSVTAPLQLSFDGASFYVDPPQQADYEEEDNDFSLVLSMTYGQNGFLFAGDCQQVRLDELLSQKGFSLSHQVLKLPHHGKKEDNSEDFIRAVEPEIAVITCSEEKQVSKKLRFMLKLLGAEVYLTSGGAVTCLSDGQTLRVIQE